MRGEAPMKTAREKRPALWQLKKLGTIRRELILRLIIYKLPAHLKSHTYLARQSQDLNQFR